MDKLSPGLTGPVYLGRFSNGTREGSISQAGGPRILKTVCPRPLNWGSLGL